MQQPGIEQQFHHLGDTASVVEIHRHVAAARLEVTDHRHALTDPLEVVDAEGDPSRTGDRQQVQHGVRGSTHRHDHADGVLECILGEQIQGSDVGLHRVHQHLCRTGGAVGLLFVFRRHR